GLVGALEYNTDLFDRETIRRLLGHYSRLLESIAASPQSQLSQLRMLRDEDELQLIDWNATDAAYASEQCIHELFEGQVERTPDRTALIFDAQTLTYSDLNLRANRLAHHLMEQGVRPDSRVGICVERGIPMLEGILAILKAGGAYVPLDPQYPAQRLRT